MSVETLTSDKVNYLIWRYLQEAGFAQTAARLQQDWRCPKGHPDGLDFAKHIGPRSLINLLHKGLKLHRLQASDRENVTPRFFGPDPDTSDNTTNSNFPRQPPSGFRTKSSSPIRRLDTNQSSLPISAPSSSSKPRNRRSNGGASNTVPTGNATSNGKPRGTTSTTIAGGAESMDVDQTGVSTASRQDEMEIDGDESKPTTGQSPSSVSSPLRNGEQQIRTNGIDSVAQAHHLQDQQQIPSPLLTPTLTNGKSAGIQFDLAPKPITTVIDTSNLRPRSINHAQWNVETSKQGSSLLAIGGEQLGQIWEITKPESRLGGNEDASLATADSATEDHVSRKKRRITPKHVVDLELEPGATLLSLAWSPHGDRLAYSVASNGPDELYNSFIRVHEKSETSSQISSYPVLSAVTGLAWSSGGRHVAGISDGSIYVVDTIDDMKIRHKNLEHDLYDLAWLGPNELVVCGTAYVAVVRIEQESLTISLDLSHLAINGEWIKLKHDQLTDAIAVVSNSGEVLIIDSNGEAHKHKAHSKSITDLIYQPIPANSGVQQRILATASEDGTVKIWNTVGGIALKQVFHLDGISVASTLAFKPESNILAAGDWDKVFFWDIESGPRPSHIWEQKRIDWHSALSNGHTTNGVNGHSHDMDMETEDEGPILRWSGMGKSLTFVYQDKIALIDVPA